MSSTSGEAPIHIVSYDESWPEQFQTERRILVQAIGEYVVGAIEHIGSTAVPRLAAKPVLDIMVGFKSLKDSWPAVAALETLEYRYFPYRPEVMHWFCKPSPQSRTHHLHLIPFESRLWAERIAFRDYLRSHSDVAEDYARVKRRFAGEYRLDREAYTDAKEPFVRRVLELALGIGSYFGDRTTEGSV